jgi:hypothetical protein
VTRKTARTSTHRSPARKATRNTVRKTRAGNRGPRAHRRMHNRVPRDASPRSSDRRTSPPCPFAYSRPFVPIAQRTRVRPREFPCSSIAPHCFPPPS